MLSQADKSITPLSIGAGGALTPGARASLQMVPLSASAASGASSVLYVGAAPSDEVQAFSVDASGSLRALPDLATAVPPGPITMAQAGAFLYVGCNSAIAAFNDGVSIALGTVPGSPFAFPGLTQQLAIDSFSRFLYVLEKPHGPGVARIRGFAVDLGTGALTPVPGSPFEIPGPNGGIAVDGANNLYVSASTSLGGPLNDHILTFHIGTDGGLTQTATVETDPFPGLLLMDASGFLYVAHEGPRPAIHVYQATINGALTKTSMSVAVPAAAAALAFHSRTDTIYVALNGRQGLAAFHGASTGGLAAVPGSPYLVGNDTSGVVVFSRPRAIPIGRQ